MNNIFSELICEKHLCRRFSNRNNITTCVRHCQTEPVEQIAIIFYEFTNFNIVIPSIDLRLWFHNYLVFIYFIVLCGNRVSQMTRAYDDIEAVTRLLEEKEKDLELTVQIGKELLTQNNALEARVADLETDLKASNDDRAQLVHELHKKNELISVLTNDADDGTDTGELKTDNVIYMGR